MRRRQRSLATLSQELKTMDVFDRVHDLTIISDPVSERAYASRQVRRSQIVAEIKELRESGLVFWNLTRISSGVILLCAIGYVTMHYLFK